MPKRMIPKSTGRAKRVGSGMRAQPRTSGATGGKKVTSKRTIRTAVKKATGRSRY